MFTSTPPIAFLATANAQQACEFYGVQIGLTFLDECEAALLFESQGVQIRIQKVAKVDPQPHTVLGWEVSSIDETVQDLTARGVSFRKYTDLEQSELGIWNAPSGAKVAWFADPDGNTLSVTER